MRTPRSTRERRLGTNQDAQEKEREIRAAAGIDGRDINCNQALPLSLIFSSLSLPLPFPGEKKKRLIAA